MVEPESALPVCVCVCVSVCDRRQKQAQHHTQGNMWSPTQLCLQLCIIPVTQPEIALLWQFIYYSQASCFCLCVSVTHIHTHTHTYTQEEVFPTPFKYKHQDSLFYFGLCFDLLTLLFNFVLSQRPILSQHHTFLLNNRVVSESPHYYNRGGPTCQKQKRHHIFYMLMKYSLIF